MVANDWGRIYSSWTKYLPSDEVTRVASDSETEG